MRIILKIAKNELRHLFYSPIAWFLGLVMLVLSAVFYTSYMYFISKLMGMMVNNQPEFKYYAVDSITALFFGNPSSGFFASMLKQLYLFVPLLTMGVINKEFNNGTIKLLYSSPVKLRQIVLGKYLAMAVYCLLLIAICGIFIIVGFADIQSLDFPPLLAASLGLFLLLSALTAIGFFMSSLTSYQIVAAIASFTLFFLLSRIGGLWQQYDLIRDLTWFLSVNGRTENMITGLISSKDILYYLLIIFMFVSFTYLKMQDGLETRKWFIRTARYLSVIFITLTLGYLGSRPAATVYVDTTAQQLRTAHPNTQKILSQLNEGPLEVTFYVNLLHGAAIDGQPSGRNAYRSMLWEKYQRFKTDIDFKYVYYYAVKEGDSSLYKIYPGKTLRQIAGITARDLRMDSAIWKPVSEIPEQAMLKAENYRGLMQLRYKNKSSLLYTFTEEGTVWPIEENIAASLSRLLDKPVPKLYFVTGELERSIHKKGEREFHSHTFNKYAKGALINLGFDMDTLNLTTQNIPASAAMLILADPKVDLSATVVEKIRQYINAGGNIMLMGEPGKQYVMNPLLREIGVQLKAGQLVQPSANETPDKVENYLTRDALDLADEKSFILRKHVLSQGYYKDSTISILAGITSLAISDSTGFEVKPLLMTRPGRSWLKTGRLVSDSTAPVFTPQEGDSQELSGITGIQLTLKINNREQRIIVTGDADVLSAIRGNGELMHAFYSWSVYNHSPVYMNLPFARDNMFTISPERAGIQKILFVWVLPALILITATVLLIRRKRK